MKDNIDSVPQIEPEKVNKFSKKNIKRDEDGLIIGLDYEFNEEGMIDWRKLVPKEFLYINSEAKKRDRIEKKYHKKFEELDIEKDKIEDIDLVITLGGLKKLLRIRGYSRVDYWVKEANENYAAVTCSIDFLPNYETEGKEISYSENACAHSGNTSFFGKLYLLEMASNRALARCIRNFLNINIVSREELGAVDNNVEEAKSSIPNVVANLSRLLEDRGLTIEDIKKDYPQTSDKWKSVSDIPKAKIFEIIGKLKQN